MRLKVDSKATEWLTKQLNLHAGSTVRILVRYGGDAHIQPGFSLALTIETPKEVAVSTKCSGVSFYIEEDDLWYFDGHDLHVVYLNDDDGIEYVVEL